MLFLVKEEYMDENKKNKKKNKSNFGWISTLTLLAFIISIIFSLLSEIIMPKVNIVIGVLLMLLFIFIGILFDIIGVAVTIADEQNLHSMNSKKIEGASLAVNFKKNANKVSSFCNDVIGDICGIISGSAGVYVATKLSVALNINSLISALFITGVISSLTIGGKAIGKVYAIENCTSILFNFSKILSKFDKK